jgi:lysophospholipase L1-like esterase
VSVLAAAVALTALAVASCGHGDTGTAPAGLGAQVTGTPAAVVPAASLRLVAAPGALASCELRIEHAANGQQAVAVVGSSVTAGTGPDNPRLSWAVALAGNLRRDTVIAAVPGIGYVRAGSSGLGPVSRLIADEDLRRLRPSLVIIQAGHDDSNVSAAVEQSQVERTIGLVRADAPGARIALLTVFATAGQPVPAALYRIDRAIAAGGRAADPGVIVMDPLAGQWGYARARDGLHPTAAGDAWIARRVADILRTRDALPHAVTAGTPLICDYTG